MSELPGGEHVRPGPRIGDEQPALAIAATAVGQILALLAAVTDAVALNIAVFAGLGGCVLAIVALVEAAPAELRIRRAVAALIGAQGLAAAILLSGLSPSVPTALPLAALAAAAATAAIGGAGLA